MYSYDCQTNEEPPISFEDMDPSMYLPYTPPNGLPQESKLVTYMNHNTSTTPTRNLTNAMGNLSLDTPPPPPPEVKKVLVNEFVPVNYYPAPPLMQEPPENAPIPITVVTSTPQMHQVYMQENVGGTTYFYSANTEKAAPLDGAAPLVGTEPILTPGAMCPGAVAPGPFLQPLYTAVPPPIGPITAKPGLAPLYYTPDTIRSELYARNADAYLEPDTSCYSDIPGNVDVFVDLSPLETVISHPMTEASSFRVTHREFGNFYALRRIHGVSAYPSARLEKWKLLDHPNIVKLEDYFVSSAFNDHSVAMVYEHHATSVTLMSKYLSGGGIGNAPPDGSHPYHDPFSSDPDAPRPYTYQKNAILRAVANGALLPESVIWSILIQLTAALRAIHSAGLACRKLDATKVIVTGYRVRIAWGGAFDVLNPAPYDIAQAQQEDLTALGRIALSLACRTVHCDNVGVALDIISRSYSADFRNWILYLLSTNPARRSVNDLMPIIGARFYSQVDALERRNDALENQVAGELDNGRLLRILIKLGVINERPELNLDSSWSETGDRYMLKLFRDYLFHSVNEEGRPCLDYAHVAYCLNQLDCGTTAKVELMTRDEQSVLVVSYAELKHCLEQTYDELMEASATPR